MTAKTRDIHVGHSAHGRETLDVASLKAHVYWKEDGKIVESEEYSLEELDAFIAELDPQDQFRDQCNQAREVLAKRLDAKWG